MLLRLSIVCSLILLIDWYFYQAVRTGFAFLSPAKMTWVTWSYWMFTAVIFAVIFTFYFFPVQSASHVFPLYFLSLVIIGVFCKLLGIFPLLADDLFRLLRWLIDWFQRPGAGGGSGGISRSLFLNRLALFAGAVPFAAFFYGMVKTAFDFQVRRLRLRIPHLPETFHGLRIVQISDIHIGSFMSPAPLEKAIRRIEALSPDLIFFTGDLVNHRASEAEPFIGALKKIRAPMGVYSIFGNHDYGLYTRWNSEAERLQNLERLKEIHREAGWKLLLNESAILRKDGGMLAVAGVENWSAVMRFPLYGDLMKAMKETGDAPVKILLSHDPSHWKAEVLRDHPGISLTLSGHTHGMQFGVEIPGFRWSPVQYIYKEWAGLYREGEQYLYVNRGLGFIGYMGRVGIAPEITLIELET